MNFEWQLREDGRADIGFAIANDIIAIAGDQLPDLAELFPFHGNWDLQAHLDTDWLAARIVNRGGTGVPTVGKLEDKDLAILRERAIPTIPQPHDALRRTLGAEWFAFDRFSYVGPYRAPYASWPDVHQHIIDWLNALVVPEVLRRNQKRVLRAIPQPPQFDLEPLRRFGWVLECEEEFRQGTAFEISGGRLITCQHVLGPRTVAFRPESPSRRFRVRVAAEQKTIDLAVLAGC
jgi:hypothetical protein